MATLSEDERNSIKADILRSIDEKFDQKFDRTVDLLKVAIGTALKVFGWTLALLFVILTLFGIKTASDLKSSAVEAAKFYVSESISSLRPEDIYKNSLDSIYTDSLINAVSISLSRSKAYSNFAKFPGPFDSSSEFYLTNEQTDFLLKKVIDEKTTREKFGQIVSTIAGGVTGEAAEGTYTLFTRMLDQSDSEFLWMRNQFGKQSVILSTLVNLDHVQPSEVIRKYLVGDAQNEDVRRLAIRYSAVSGDYQAVDDLEVLALGDSPDIRDEAIVSLGRLKPGSKVLASWLNTFYAASSTTHNDARNALRILLAIAEGPGRGSFFEGPEDKVRSETASAVLRKLIQHGVLFSIRNEYVGVSLENRRSSTGHEGSSEFLRLIPGLLPAVLAEASVSQNLDFAVKLVRALSIETDGNKEYLKLVPSTDFVAILEDGRTVVATDMPNGFVLQATDDNRPSVLIISWADETNINRTGTVKSFDLSKISAWSLGDRT